MAENTYASSSEKQKLSTEEADTLLREARDQWDRAYERERSNIEMAYEDLEFLAGAQWDSKQKETRENDDRPCLTVNQLPQFVHQVTGDIRQMRPAIKAVPVDDVADPQVAELNTGLIRYIENRSDAAGVYFQAADQQVAAGIGHWRVLTEYADESTFNQEIRIAGIDDGIAVLWDPDAKRLTREDANYCFVPVDFSHGGFKKRFPDASLNDFATLGSWANLSGWYTDEHVRVAEYWLKKPITRTLALMQSGQIIDITDDDEEQTKEEKLQLVLQSGARIEQRDSFKICRYLLTATEILEGPEEWVGRYIPIIPVVGEEVRIGRKIIRNGIVRHAKDPQRMYNYFRSAQTEVVALQPKQPYMVTEQNVAKYQDVWSTANKKNWPFLPYEPDAKNGGAAPQRIVPALSSQGINEGVLLANEDLRRVIGIYDASLGAKSNETSGVAIKARQTEGDTGTYVYIDNFARAVRHTGKILIDLIPHVYDTERTIRIMGEDGKIDLIAINQAKLENGQPVTLNDVTVGAYDVVAEVGPSYTTKREEARDGMLEFMKAVPQTAPLIMDKVAKAQDWPMADDIAKRIRAMLPPAILQAEELEEQGASPEQIKQAMAQAQQAPPDPKMVQIQMQAELENKKQQFEQQKAMADVQLEMRRLAEESRQSQAEMLAMMQKMYLDSQTKIEVAQINAGVGMHKNIVQAGVEETKTVIGAQVKANDAAMRAESARYAVDNRPEPKPSASN